MILVQKFLTVAFFCFGLGKNRTKIFRIKKKLEKEVASKLNKAQYQKRKMKKRYVGKIKCYMKLVFLM